MKAIAINFTGTHFSPTEWPEGVLDQMDSAVLVNGLFPLRKLSGFPMTPSSLAEAHVRIDGGESQHSTKHGARLSTATDIHVKDVSTYPILIGAALALMASGHIGGFGVYFDTNTPMFHIDTRSNGPLVWLRDSDGSYLYLQNTPQTFWKKLYHEMEWASK